MGSLLKRQAIIAERLGFDAVNAGSHLTAAEVEWANAILAYRRRYSRPFPTNHELLAVARSLGYRKTARRAPLPDPRTTDPVLE